MGKDSPKDAQSKITRQRKGLRSKSGKFLKPGALAQIRYAKASASSAKCTDLGKKRVAVVDTAKAGRNIQEGNPLMLSPLRFPSSPFAGTDDIDSKFLTTPKSYGVQDSESRLESLPFDIQVKIICLLQHDQLRAVFHVSRKVRKAVLMARQFHFNYTTPDRAKREFLMKISPLPTEQWLILRNNEEEGNGMMRRTPSPHTPKAPRHGPRPSHRYKFAEMRQITSVLFQDSVFPSRCIVPSVLPKPLFKSLASNRVLVYEDELCKAVAKNKLR
ncbi:F-box protein At4g35930-like [Impatiens glandulifera]|uniref:F-box protein At4g35930-like n=1 Tax=Impatiens glandulifera TaxID=253017 RepID=UPI001FB07E3B|nr:F-box protein At4g35930-like [Impatiens glandulifera]